MNILLITDSYPPEIRSTAPLMQELAEELKKRGHEVNVVTSYPRYNLSENERRNSFGKFVDEGGIKVLRVKTPPHHKVNFILRGINQLILPFLFFRNIKRYIKSKINIVIVYSPPLPLAGVGEKIKKRYQAKYILNIQDIFPQNAVDLGILRHKPLIKFFEELERRAYQNADEIVVHSQGNKEFLVKIKKVPSQKIHIIHNWIDVTAYKNTEGDGYFREKYELRDKFIFLFAGVIGPSQGLEVIIRAAEEITKIPEICFLIVGDGTEKEKLVKEVKKLGLKNVIFKPFVSREEYPRLVKEVDVGVVCLSSKNKTPVVPGKILGYMAGSKPIVAFLNKESDGHTIIKEAKCGYSAVSDDHKKIVDVLLRMYNERNRLKEFGEQGFKYLSQHFTPEACGDKIEKLFFR